MLSPRCARRISWRRRSSRASSPKSLHSEAVGVGVEAVVALDDFGRQQLAVERGDLFGEVVWIEFGAAAFHAAHAAAGDDGAGEGGIGNFYAEPGEAVGFGFGGEVQFALGLLGIVGLDQAEEAAGEGAIFVDAAAVVSLRKMQLRSGSIQAKRRSRTAARRVISALLRERRWRGGRGGGGIRRGTGRGSGSSRRRSWRSGFRGRRRRRGRGPRRGGGGGLCGGGVIRWG